MHYYNSRTDDDGEYNRGIPQPMKRQKQYDGAPKKHKDDKRRRREAVERKRGS